MLAEARHAALDRLGIESADAGRLALRNHARRGRLPWCDPRYKERLAYISAGDVLLVPVAHCLLRGLVRSLFIYALDTQVSSVHPNHPVVFNKEQRARVKVC